MSTDQTIDFVVMFLVIGLLVLGMGSWLLGWLLQAWDRLMSRRSLSVPVSASNAVERRSYAEEQAGSSVEPSAGTSFRSVITYLEQCDDDLLLNILAQLQSPSGDYRFADSRIAKFIPGRDDDRLTQVREARDTTPPSPPPRMYRIRDAAGERLIPVEGDIPARA